MDIMVILYAILAYLIGSIPSGLIIGKTFFNTDVRQYGSKNIGATNTYRVIGLKAALPVFLCDALKGAAGVVLLSSYGPMYMILGGILAMMGHNWSIFLGFKGGRGVATGLGVLIALSPLVALIAFLVWGVIVYFTRITRINYSCRFGTNLNVFYRRILLVRWLWRFGCFICHCSPLG